MIRIRQGRTKESALEVGIDFQSPFEEVKLKIYGLPKAWRTFYVLSMIDPELIARNINLLSIAKSVFDKIESEPGRGPHRGREDFVRKAKEIATYIYCWANYWLKKPRNEWPDSLQKVIRECENRLEEPSHFGKAKRFQCSLITAYIMEKHCGKERRKHGLNKWTDDPDAFRRTYIGTNDFAKCIKAKSKQFIEKGIFDTDLPL